jgi:3-phosphoshikimate 1-carboxyvinyltransferase
MGASIQTQEDAAPLAIHGGRPLKGIDYTLPVASAQLKSALLLAGLWANGRTIVRSPGPSRDHTERMLKTMGVVVDQPANHVVSLSGPAQLEARDLEIPGDFSSAAFFVVAGLLGASDGLLIRNVGINPTRTGLLTILQEMGGRIELRNIRDCGAEPVADLMVIQSDLAGIEVDPAVVPLAIDEFPALFIAAARARGRTVVSGAEELRHKESDRLSAMAEGLRTLGVAVEEYADGLIIEGGRLCGGRVDSYGDHRVAMAFAIAGMDASGPIEILRTAEVSTSFPGFLSVAAGCGLEIEARQDEGYPEYG